MWSPRQVTHLPPVWDLIIFYFPLHRHQIEGCQVVIRNERDILNVVTSKAPKVGSRPSGVL